METGEVLAPRRNPWKKAGPITVDTGKGLNGSRMVEWPVGATKESNVSGVKGPAELDSFDRKVRLVRHCQTKETATDRLHLTKYRASPRPYCSCAKPSREYALDPVPVI
jgi:hypothetical protein